MTGETAAARQSCRSAAQAAGVEIDLALLEEMIEAVGEAGFAAIVEAFARDAAEQLRQLSAAAAQRDGERTRSAAHKLRGQFAQLGMAGLARRFGRIEADAAVETGPLEDIRCAALAGIETVGRLRA